MTYSALPKNCVIQVRGSVQGEGMRHLHWKQPNHAGEDTNLLRVKEIGSYSVMESYIRKL